MLAPLAPIHAGTTERAAPAGGEAADRCPEVGEPMYVRFLVSLTPSGVRPNTPPAERSDSNARSHRVRRRDGRSTRCALRSAGSRGLASKSHRPRAKRHPHQRLDQIRRRPRRLAGSSGADRAGRPPPAVRRPIWTKCALMVCLVTPAIADSSVAVSARSAMSAGERRRREQGHRAVRRCARYSVRLS